jgi:AP-2 complex subunit alpha
MDRGGKDILQGYVACTLMLNEQNDILRLIIQSVKNDLNSANENTQCLALTCIANVGGEEFAESLVGDVQRLLVSA